MTSASAITEKSRLDGSGRIVVPSRLRRAADLHPGEDVVFVVEDGGLRLYSLRAAVRHAQDIVRRHVAADRSLSDELISQRRAAARLEASEPSP